MSWRRNAVRSEAGQYPGCRGRPGISGMDQSRGGRRSRHFRVTRATTPAAMVGPMRKAPANVPGTPKPAIQATTPVNIEITGIRRIVPRNRFGSSATFANQQAVRRDIARLGVDGSLAVRRSSTGSVPRQQDDDGATQKFDIADQGPVSNVSTI